MPLLAATFSAALPSAAAAQLLLISNGCEYEKKIINTLRLTPLAFLPERGTVSIAMLDLALQLTSANVFLAGVDFATNDMRTHSRPYYFDTMLEYEANRLCPYYTKKYVRSIRLNEGAVFNIYAQWFKRNIAKYPARVFSVGGDAGAGNIPPGREMLTALLNNAEAPRKKVVLVSNAVNQRVPK
jgi:hypothetical protein